MPTCATQTANETTSSHAVGAIAHTGQGEQADENTPQTPKHCAAQGRSELVCNPLRPGRLVKRS